MPGSSNGDPFLCLKLKYMSEQSLYKTMQSSDQFFLIAGPCVVEDRDLLFEVAERVKGICEKFEIPFIFKSSYRKANRSSASSFAGIGDEKALGYLKEVGDHFNIPVTTDIHSDPEASLASHYVDVLQIPAFLCRQTSLLQAAADTGKIVTIKKGQFMSPEAMRFAVEKVREHGNHQVGIIERGNTFGYQDLVVDFRGIPVMRSFDVPVIMDCTHSLQQPNQSSGVTGGRPALIETISRAAIAVGADGLFIETHPEPSSALSDGANMLPLSMLEPLLERLAEMRSLVRKWQ